MNFPRIRAAMAGALALFAVAPAFALEPMKLPETAANLANIKMLLGSRADVTFTSDVPTNPEGGEAPDVLTAFGQTRRGESGLIVSPTANLQRLEPVKEIAFYDDAGLTEFSDLVVYYEDNRFQEGFGFYLRRGARARRLGPRARRCLCCRRGSQAGPAGTDSAEFRNGLTSRC
jgi:hypothetical protein